MNVSRCILFIVLGLMSNTLLAAPISIDDESFGVFYESPMNSNKGLILYISNKNCVGSYQVANNEIVIANGSINARGPEKIIHFGTTRFRVDCGPLQSLVITRQ